MTKNELAAYIDHTALKADVKVEAVEKICREAVQNKFASVCVNPYWVPRVSGLLQQSGVKTCTVIGFPLGASSPKSKQQEAEIARAEGAQELDMVINLGALKSGDRNAVLEDIKGVVQAAGGGVVKVIIETCFLTRDEKIEACLLAQEAAADFVKTSTGFGSGGATTEDVQLMRQTVGKSMKIKASGGIRSLEQALEMIDAGADRIGASAGVAIISELA